MKGREERKERIKEEKNRGKKEKRTDLRCPSSDTQTAACSIPRPSSSARNHDQTSQTSSPSVQRAECRSQAAVDDSSPPASSEEPSRRLSVRPPPHPSDTETLSRNGSSHPRQDSWCQTEGCRKKIMNPSDKTNINRKKRTHPQKKKMCVSFIFPSCSSFSTFFCPSCLLFFLPSCFPTSIFSSLLSFPSSISFLPVFFLPRLTNCDLWSCRA